MFLDFLFGRKNRNQPAAEAAPTTPAPQAAATAPGTRISFNPELVPQLKADHQKLLAIFGSISQAFNAEDLEETVQHLEIFRGAIQNHLLTENVRFYIYLEHALLEDPQSHALVHEFRHEMDGIGKAVLAFLGKYRQMSTQPNLAASFGGDLSLIGQVLVERIQREEEILYPLYLPVY